MTATAPRMARAGRTALWYAPAVLVFVGVIVVWELLVRALDIRAFILPAPTAIVAALIENWGAGRWPLFNSAITTLFEAVGGLVIGTTIAVTRVRSRRVIA